MTLINIAALFSVFSITVFAVFVTQFMVHMIQTEFYETFRANNIQKIAELRVNRYKIFKRLAFSFMVAVFFIFIMVICVQIIQP